MIHSHVHISTNVSKLGAQIPSINLPVDATCRSDVPCKKKCYARRGHFQRPKSMHCLQTNLDIWRNEADHFERDAIIAASQSRYFRWHSSGDIPNAEYLSMMARVACALPETCFLAFTKKYELVNHHLDAGLTFPPNLRIVLSAWGSWVPFNPHNLPVAYIKFKSGEYAIPATAKPCSQYCGDCVTTGQSCWDLGCGESVFFCEH